MNRNTSLLRIKITLLDIDPPIWRRILVPATYRFWDLHVAIQDAMGWMDFFHHAFHSWDDTDFGRHIGIPCADDPACRIRASWDYKVADFLCFPAQSMLYEYGMNDEWVHEVLLEDILPREEEKKYPICVDGEGTCPPEECGGPDWYRRIVTALRGKRIEYKPDPEFLAELERVVSDEATRYPPFNPDGFDIGRVRFDHPAQRLEKKLEEEGFLSDDSPEEYSSTPDLDDATPAAADDTPESVMGDDLVERLLGTVKSGRFSIEELRSLLEYAEVAETVAKEILRRAREKPYTRYRYGSPSRGKRVVPAIYCLNITLDESSPPIWRRLLLPNTIDLKALHPILMHVMGWEYDHYHHFIFKGWRFLDTHHLLTRWLNTSPELGTILGTLLLKAGDAITYGYDFRGRWKHTVTLEEIRPWTNADGSPAEGSTPVCIGGGRRCPPEEVEWI
jgi:hypothetical protein